MGLTNSTLSVLGSVVGSVHMVGDDNYGGGLSVGLGGGGSVVHGRFSGGGFCSGRFSGRWNRVVHWSYLKVTFINGY